MNAHVSLPVTGRERPASLARIIILRLIFYTSMLLGGVGILNYVLEYNRLDEQLRKNLAAVTERLSSGIALSVWNADERQILNNIVSGMHDRTVHGITLVVQEKSYYFTRDKNWLAVQVPSQFPTADLIARSTHIIFNQRELGELTVYATPQFMRDDLRHTIIKTTGAIILFEMTLVMVLYLLLWKTILKPIRRLEQYALAVSSDERVVPTEVTSFHGELGILRRAMEDMVAQLDARYAELQAFRDNLEVTVAERTADLKKAKLAAENAQSAAETANRAKSAFLASMSHEIRTPMNAILGYAQLMSRDGTLSSGQRDKVDTINRAGEHLLSLINDVLEMSKIEAGSVTRNDSAFDLHALLNELMEIYSGRAKAKRLTCVLELSERVPHLIISDESKVRQSLVNLLGNAVKFTASGGIVVLADSAQGSEGTHAITLAVRDSGPGLRPEEIAKLFRPFVQSDAGKSIGGTGLGLAISRQYARLLGGDITVDSKFGEGATFTFSFHAESARAADIAAKDTAPPLSRLAAGQSARVLAADDVEDNRNLLLHMLTDLRFEVRVAANGAEALAAFQEWTPDAVLMDIQMPVMNGLEAIRRIKATPEGRACFVVALSASALEEEKAAVLASGADVFMRKPFKDTELVALLGRRLNLHFESIEPSTPEAPAPPREADFSRIPESLRADLHKAAREADYDVLLTLCDQLSAAGHPEAAEALRASVGVFDYDGVAVLLGASADDS